MFLKNKNTIFKIRSKVTDYAALKVRGKVDDFCIYNTTIVRPANRDLACQTERCNTLSNKTSLQ